MLPLHTFGNISGHLNEKALKVLFLDEALLLKQPPERVAIFLGNEKINLDLKIISDMGFAAVIVDNLSLITNDSNIPKIFSIRNPEVVSNGDIIRIKPKNGQISVLYRRGANANSLFVTERCNSKCVMCSQPPKEQDDSWLVNEILDFIPLIDKELEFLGITGGEPTLLGEKLGQIIQACENFLPTTKLHILTNGKNFANDWLVSSLAFCKGYTIWGIPLYSDLPHIHDFIVQSKNAFNETLNGLYNLAEHGHSIELRFVMHKQTISRIKQFVEFVYHNLPFVSHVALMGLEPIGYGKVNLDSLWINPKEYSKEINDAAWFLEDRNITTSIYNVPLCALAESTWPLAKQSISDWKNKYYSECDKCLKRSECCGFFASHGSSCPSDFIKAIT